jgi:signal transduction histidine kinase
MLHYGQSGLRAKIGIAFILQAAAISCGTVLGVYAAAAVLEDVLMKRALREETEHYVELLERNPLHPTPDTYNMKGFLQRPGDTDEVIPPDLRGLDLGFHVLRQEGSRALVFVSDSTPGRLFLVIDQAHIGQLALFFGLVPLTVVLLFIYLATWLTYRLSRRAISPVIWLANEVRSWDPKNPDFSALAPDRVPPDIEGETLLLSESIYGFGLRIGEFVDRERNFTRDASHELRTPLTVIKMASEVLISDGQLDDYAMRNARRILGSARDMEALIEAFLLMAREADNALPADDFAVNSVVREEMERAEALVADKPIRLELIEHAKFCLHAPSKVVAVLIGNLIRNAVSYTDQGFVRVVVDLGVVTVEDTGVGMSEQDLKQIFQPFFRAQHSRSGGHGVGLTIVKRLSDRYRWPIEFESELGKGTSVRVRFPDCAQVKC